MTLNLHPPRSSYKALFQGTELGEALKRMLLSKAVPEGLKCVEGERGIGGKNSLICYIPEQDPIQEALETKHQPSSFKLSLPSGSEMRMVRWASGTPEHFLIYVRGGRSMPSRKWSWTPRSKRLQWQSSLQSWKLTLPRCSETNSRRGRGMIPPSRLLEPARPLQTRPGSPKRQSVMNPLQPRLLQPRQPSK